MRRRRVARWAIPVLLAGAAYGGGVMVNRTSEGQAIVGAVEARALAATAALGFAVSDVEVEGRKMTDPAAIMAALGVERGTPILAVSPSRAQQLLEGQPWVRSATVERRLPGTLVVRLVERQPLAVWQHDGKQQLIDREGEVIAVKDLSRYPMLPTVVGADAAVHAAALFEMLMREPALAARVTAAVRVDDRRWNLRIDHAIDVLLPEEDPAAAWARLAALEGTKNLLQRDIETVDMRLPDRLVLRVANPNPNPPAPLGQLGHGSAAAPVKKPRAAAGRST
jgi:cell division protein FtsQ